jgi:hypothetical protein
MHVIVSFPAPVYPKSQNKKSSRFKDADNAKLWRQAAERAFRLARKQLEPYKDQHIMITVGIPFPADRRPRDSNNYHARVVKPICDGITDAKTLWPNDTDIYCSPADPIIWRGGHEVRCRIELAPPDWDPADEA